MEGIPNEYLKLFTAAASVYISRSQYTSRESLAIMARNTLEPLVFETLINRYGKFFNAHWEDCIIPVEADKALVIVERRCHPYLEFCIKNAVYFNPGYSLHIYCSQANFEYIKLICGKKIDQIHIHTIWRGLGTPEEGRAEYNTMLRTRKFWEDIPAEHIITFETDSYFLRPVPPTIYEYDYVASRWAWKPDEPGGGGISYRKRSVMLDICDRYKNEATVMQDCFVSEGVKALGYKYPSFEKNTELFSESYISNKSVGVHQWWTFVVQAPIKSLLPIFHDHLTLRI